MSASSLLTSHPVSADVRPVFADVPPRLHTCSPTLSKNRRARQRCEQKAKNPTENINFAPVSET